jgi:hypothetical protein
MQEGTEVPESLQAALRLFGLPAQASALGGAATAAQQVVRTEPVEQRVRVGNVVMRLPTRVAQRVGECDEQLLGLRRLGHRFPGHRSVCSMM